MTEPTLGPIQSTRAKAKAAAKVGWYPHPNRANTVAEWDGTAWTGRYEPAPAAHGRMSKPEGLIGLMITGVVVSAIGVAVFVLGSESELMVIIGMVLFAIGSTVVTVTVIAIGIVLGFRQVDWERQQRR